MIKLLSIIGMMTIVLAGCSLEKGEPDEIKTITSPAETVTNGEGQNGKNSRENYFIKVKEAQNVASHLKIPWAMTKHGDTFYVTEREGTIARIEGNAVYREQVELAENVLHFGEGGLLGFVLDPLFSENKKAYLYHTYGTEENVLNRVVEVEYQNNKWVETRILLDKIKGDRFHNGGRILIGPDAKLYITTGDALNEGSSQKIEELAGKILRIELDGSYPEDNPFPNSPVYSYGHRNPQGLAWDEQGRLYSSEHGPTAHDEINRIKAGLNYGWPEIIGDEPKEGMEAPLFQSGNETWAPSGMIYYKGSLYVAALRGEKVLGFHPETHQTKVIWEGEGRVRDLFLAEGKLYMITSNTDGRGVPMPGDDRLVELVIE